MSRIGPAKPIRCAALALMTIAVAGAAAGKARAEESPGDPFTVAVIDTPVHLESSLLAQARLHPAGRALTRAALGRGQCGARNSHGTRMAAIVHGTAPQAQLLPIPVVDCPGDEIRAERVSRAIGQALDLGADLINLSMTYPAVALASRGDPILERLDRSDVPLVIAAGNSADNLSRRPEARYWKPGAPLVDQVYLVGVRRKETPDGYGVHPGETPILKSRFRRVAVDKPVRAGGRLIFSSGTSGAAARFSGRKARIP